MNNIVMILMTRDGMTADEATELLRDVQQRAKEALYDAEIVEELMADELGLELDYIFDLLEDV